MPDVVPELPKPVPLNLEGIQCGEVNPVPSEGRLLTRLQYQNSVVDVFRGQLQGTFTSDFPVENDVMGFRTNAEFHRISPWLAEAHLVAAEAVSDQVVQKLSELLPCSTSGVEIAACGREFLEVYGARAFRRPLTDSERAPLLALFDSASAEAGLTYGVQLLTQALLQSPQFLYRLELEAPAVGKPVEASGAVALNSYELASRLSYLLWNSIPDDALLDAASRDELRDPVVLEAEARRLLADPRARSTALDFSRQWLRTSDIDAVVRVSEFASDNGLATSWRGSLELFLDDVFASDQPTFDNLFSSTSVFLNAQLAPVYNSEIPASLIEGYFYPTTQSAEQRAGLLTQPGLMALLAHPDQSAPILRGVFVRERLLCQPPPAAPPTVDQTPPAPDPNATTRERFSVHTSQSACAGCHQLIDPVGLAFENYDHLGRFRSEENGLPVDASGALNATLEPAIEGPFNGAIELAERLKNSSQAQACYVTQWYRYGMGRVEQAEDLCSIRSTLDAFQASGGDIKQGLVGLVMSDAFRLRSASAGEQL